MEDILGFFLEKGTPIHCKQKTHLIKEGQRSRKVFFVKEGVVRHYVITSNGKEKTIRISKEQDFFYSSIVSFFKNESSYIYCQCLTDCELLYWTSETLDSLFLSHPELVDFKNEQLVKFILEKHNKEISLLTKNSEERYREFCDTHLELFNRIPHHIIASYIDITPETLSRLRARQS